LRLFEQWRFAQADAPFRERPANSAPSDGAAP